MPQHPAPAVTVPAPSQCLPCIGYAIQCALENMRDAQAEAHRMRLDGDRAYSVGAYQLDEDGWPTADTMAAASAEGRLYLTTGLVHCDHRNVPSPSQAADVAAWHPTPAVQA